jgi:peptidoglycan/xylan/chitin deacetylase (PgdA/CDA1 family)
VSRFASATHPAKRAAADRTRIVPAVPGIIKKLKHRGYVFVTVPQLLAPGKAEPGTVYR